MFSSLAFETQAKERKLLEDKLRDEQREKERLQDRIRQEQADDVCT